MEDGNKLFGVSFNLKLSNGQIATRQVVLLSLSKQLAEKRVETWLKQAEPWASELETGVTMLGVSGLQAEELCPSDSFFVYGDDKPKHWEGFPKYSKA